MYYKYKFGVRKANDLLTDSRLLSSEMAVRFDKFTDPTNSNYDPFFVTATLLDPRYKVVLTTNQIISIWQKHVYSRNLRKMHQNHLAYVHHQKIPLMSLL